MPPAMPFEAQSSASTSHLSVCQRSGPVERERCRAEGTGPGPPPVTAMPCPVSSFTSASTSPAWVWISGVPRLAQRPQNSVFSAGME